MLLLSLQWFFHYLNSLFTHENREREGEKNSNDEDEEEDEDKDEKVFLTFVIFQTWISNFVSIEEIFFFWFLKFWFTMKTNLITQLSLSKFIWWEVLGFVSLLLYFMNKIHQEIASWWICVHYHLAIILIFMMIW